MTTYYLTYLPNANCGNKLVFTREYDWQWDVAIFRGDNNVPVDWVTASMRKARALGFISIFPDPDTAFITIKQDNVVVGTANSLNFSGTTSSINPIDSSEVNVQVTSGDTVPDYTTLIDDVGSGVTYIGYAVPGTATSAASWKIKKLIESGDDAQVLFANGAATFVNIWDNRASLGYTT